MYTTTGLNAPGITPSSPQHISFLPAFGAAKQLSAGITSDRIGLTANIRGLRLVARGAAVRFTLGTYNVVADDTDHYLEEGMSILISLREGENYAAAIRANSVEGTLEISELL